jgi:tetratricopeptide (TPR) repeat protein
MQRAFGVLNAAAAGDLDSAITLLRGTRSPAAGEMLAELLRTAGRFDEALTVCDETWQFYGAPKALQDKINILANMGDFDGAEACAAELLGNQELPAEQRRQLHRRLIERRALRADWAAVEACCRAALRDHPGEDDFTWGLISAQLNQGRWDAAWVSCSQLRPEIQFPEFVVAWVELKLRFGPTLESGLLVKALTDRFAEDQVVQAQLARLGTRLP